MVTAPIVSIKALRKSYGSLKAVKGFDLTLAEGEVFGLLGHNGAGKSTAIECILGIKERDSGTVTILGKDPARDRKVLFDDIGVQFQETAYQDRIKVKELCRLFTSFYTKPLDYRDLLEEFCLQQKSNSYVSDLSGGQRQKLALLLAILPDPTLVFLDELTTGLDPAARRDVWNYIKGLKTKGKTIFLTTHYMEEAQELCDRVGLMKDGELIALDTPEEIVRSCGLDHVITIRSTPFSPDIITGIDGVREVIQHDTNYEIRAAEECSLIHILRRLDEHGVQIQELSMRSPELEDAYLFLTGGAGERHSKGDDSDDQEGAV